MTSTACDDQFTVGTQPIEPVRQPYDIVSILHRNVADLEIALRTQIERAEAAEAELLAVREDNHSMMLEIDGLRTERDRLADELTKLREQAPALYMAFSECGQFIRYWTRDTANLDLDATMAVNDFTVLEFYARPIPAFAAQQAATAPIVPEEWREVMAGLVGIAEAKGKKQGSPNHSHSRPGIWDDDNIRNGLAGKRCAECEMYDRARALLQSADHSEQALKMVDAVKRRCEACAILPCSCK